MTISRLKAGGPEDMTRHWSGAPPALKHPAGEIVELRPDLVDGRYLVRLELGIFLGEVVAVELVEMQVGGAVVVRQGAQRIVQVEDLPARRHLVAQCLEP